MNNEIKADSGASSQNFGNTSVGRCFMSDRKYIITQEQFETIQHHKRMFEANAEHIQELCSSKKDDVVYGFELGKIHNHLRDCFINMSHLESEIREQKVEE